MDPSVRQPLAELSCQTCHVRLGTDRGSAIHIPYDDIRAAEDGGTRAHWQAHCGRCNPHREPDGDLCIGCYEFDVHNAQDWDFHLSMKPWITYTDWSDFAGSAY